MVIDRYLEERDRPVLESSLANDQYHLGTASEFFVAPGTLCKVYEDEQGPICFVRATKALRLDIQYVDNSDFKRNMSAMIGGFEVLAQKARENGFTEVVFNTSNDALRRFCVKRFGFVLSNGELRKFL